MTMMSVVPAKNSALGLGFSGNLGNLDAYISAVNRLPMLTHEEEVSLGKRLKDQNDLGAAQNRRNLPQAVDVNTISATTRGLVSSRY